MTGKDSLVWFCGGTGGTGGEPEFIWPHDARDSGIPHPDSEAARQGVIHGVQIICGDCGRLAPFVNGCRWIDTGERRLRDVTCPQCEREFPLLWNDYSHIRPQQKQSLFIRGCPSGGIYSVSIHCPHCDYEEEL
jgi:hypothetical protein